MDKIRVFLSHDKPFIWKSENAAILREEWHIVGTLVGCLPRYPRQNNHLGLPLQLLPDEVTLLLEKDVIELVKMGDSLSSPTTEQVEEFKESRKCSYQEQVEMFREERKKEIHQNIPRIIQGKKQKLAQELDKRKERGEKIDDAEYEVEINIDVDNVPIPPIAEKHSLIHLHTRCPFPVSSSEVQWTYPATEEERTKYLAFKELWEKGHFLTSGSKFGGDFLVYPGDPARFHSHYIAICLPHKENISMLDVISMGRLGSNVRKTVLICSINNEDKLCFTSLQWTGIT